MTRTASSRSKARWTSGHRRPRTRRHRPALAGRRGTGCAVTAVLRSLAGGDGCADLTGARPPAGPGRDDADEQAGGDCGPRTRGRISPHHSPGCGANALTILCVQAVHSQCRLIGEPGGRFDAGETKQRNSCRTANRASLGPSRDGRVSKYGREIVAGLDCGRGCRTPAVTRSGPGGRGGPDGSDRGGLQW